MEVSCLQSRLTIPPKPFLLAPAKIGLSPEDADVGLYPQDVLQKKNGDPLCSLRTSLTNFYLSLSLARLIQKQKWLQVF